MADRPIIFSAPMVRALLAGRKTQTRRVIKKRAALDAIKVFGPRFLLLPGNVDLIGFEIGDSLWVRENIWQASPYPGTCPSGEPDESGRWSSRLVHYSADGDPPNTPNRHYPEGFREGSRHFSAPDPYASWLQRPSIHMPRWASRLTLAVSDVRVEKLQAITNDDARAEGIGQLKNGQWHWSTTELPGQEQRGYHTPRGAFDALWSGINGPTAWTEDPFVVAVTFDVIEAHIDAMSHLRTEPAESPASHPVTGDQS